MIPVDRVGPDIAIVVLPCLYGCGCVALVLRVEVHQEFSIKSLRLFFVNFYRNLRLCT